MDNEQQTPDTLELHAEKKPIQTLQTSENLSDLIQAAERLRQLGAQVPLSENHSEKVLDLASIIDTLKKINDKNENKKISSLSYIDIRDWTQSLPNYFELRQRVEKTEPYQKHLVWNILSQYVDFYEADLLIKCLKVLKKYGVPIPEKGQNIQPADCIEKIEAALAAAQKVNDSKTPEEQDKEEQIFYEKIEEIPNVFELRTRIRYAVRRKYTDVLFDHLWDSTWNGLVSRHEKEENW